MNNESELVPLVQRYFPPTGLEAAIQLVGNAVRSDHTRRSYVLGLTEFHVWRLTNGKPFNRDTVHAWRRELQERGLAPSTVKVRLAAIRKLAREAAAGRLLDAETAASIQQVAGPRERGNRVGNWLTLGQVQQLILAPDARQLKGVRDRAILAILVGCGLRRDETARLHFEHIQQRDERWVIVDLRGKGGRIRTVPVPAWVKALVDCWSEAAQLSSGPVLRAVHGRIGESLSASAIWRVAVHYGKEIGQDIGPHDLRRTCAKLCRAHGGELEQIQLLLGHASIQTTELYLGTDQNLTHAPNDWWSVKEQK